MVHFGRATGVLGYNSQKKLHKKKDWLSSYYAQLQHNDFPAIGFSLPTDTLSLFYIVYIT
jgi:hypothetical protein